MNRIISMVEMDKAINSLEKEIEEKDVAITAQKAQISSLSKLVNSCGPAVTRPVQGTLQLHHQDN